MQGGLGVRDIESFGFGRPALTSLLSTLTDEKRRKVRLKPGAEVEVTVEAEPEATTPKANG
jgi:hypothetical protein